VRVGKLDRSPQGSLGCPTDRTLVQRRGMPKAGICTRKRSTTVGGLRHWQPSPTKAGTTQGVDFTNCTCCGRGGTGEQGRAWLPLLEDREFRAEERG
jgi:hypothetical protein